MWTADFGGRQLAVLHNTLWNRSDHTYHTEIRPQDKGTKRLDVLLDALRRHDMIVMQRDRSRTDFTRNGYVGVFRFADLDIGDDQLCLRLTERVDKFL